MDAIKLINNIITNPISTFILGAISGSIISSFISYIKERYSSRDRMYLQILDNLSKKLYDCSKLACNNNIYQFKTSLNIYKNTVITTKNIQSINNKYKIKDNSISKLYEAKVDLLNEKTKVLDKISELHTSLIEIILYIESNYIALNSFSQHRDEYLILSKRIFEVNEELLKLLYFNEILEWEENLDDKLLNLINNKIDTSDKKISEINSELLGYISDFQVGIQNEFFSKYFRKNPFQKYTVEYRKPLIGKVIKPQKPTIKNLNMYR